jgi:glycosyltransferase involved in cell wall biosynthesis
VKLGIDAHKYARERQTGTERYSSSTIESLLRAKAPADEVTLYLSQPLPGPPPAGARLRRFRHLPLVWPWTLLGLSWELYRRPVDLLFVPAHELPLYHQRTVVTIHDVAFRKFPRAYGRLERVRQEWSTKRTLKRAWRIVTISEATKRDLVDLYGADPGKIRVVYPGAPPGPEPDHDQAPTDELLRRLRLERGRYFLYVGRIEEKKNLARLIQAFNAARKSGQLSWRLVLAGGPGEGAEAVWALIKRLHLEAEVIRPGYVSDADKARLLTASGAVVVPSLYEGFGLPVLEAFRAGSPVLASSGGSIPEVAGEAALLCPPIDTEAFKQGMIRLEADTDLRAELVRKGRERLKAFDWDASARDLWKVFKETP